MATIDLQVGASTDDAVLADVITEGEGGKIYLATHVGFGNYRAVDKRYNWMRFLGLTLEAGITSFDVAYITYVSQFDSATTVVNSTIWGNDTATPVAPTTAAEYWNLVKTTASVPFNNVGAWVLDTSYNTPSIISLFQELYASYTYSNAAIQFMHWDNASDVAARRSPYGWDVSAAKAAKLHIEYSVGVTTCPYYYRHWGSGQARP